MTTCGQEMEYQSFKSPLSQKPCMAYSRLKPAKPLLLQCRGSLIKGVN